jgi:manganese/zinc/iron transport system substrate-binding protein
VKRILPLMLLCICLVIACNRKNVSADQRVKVLATVPMIRDLVEMIGAEDVECSLLISPGIDPHSYEIVAGDKRKIAKADFVIANGLMLEHGVNLQRFMREHKNALFLGDFFLDQYKEQLIYIDGQIDPHIWMDVSLWSKSIDPIVERLSILDPSNQDQYRQRGQAAKQKLLDIDAQILRKMQKIEQDKRYIITSHDAFYYFARRYLAGTDDNWQERVMAPQGLNPQEEISLHQLDLICSHILKHDLHNLFFESNLSKQSLQRIIEVCEDKGQSVTLCEAPLYGDTVDDASGPVKNYEAMMRHNANLIASVLDAERLG